MAHPGVGIDVAFDPMDGVRGLHNCCIVRVMLVGCASSALSVGAAAPKALSGGCTR